MKGIIEKLADLGSKIMGNGQYEQQIKKSIYETIVDDLKNRKSCRCNLFIFYSKEKRNSMLQQITSKKNLKLTVWEVLTLINASADRIQNNNEKKYPIKDATDIQVEEFANEISLSTAKYISMEHKNTLIIPIQGLPEQAREYLNGKILPNVKFLAQNNSFNIELAINGPLVYGSHNIAMTGVNAHIQTILCTGILLDFFNTSPLQKSALSFKEAKFEKTEDYVTIDKVFSNETESLFEDISIDPYASENAEKYFRTLSKILNDDLNSPALMYSLTWYCKSLDLGDIKTIFICRYIGFEALSGIWTKSNKNYRTSQDKVKNTIPALLAKDITDFNEKQSMLKNIIDLRNELFHGDNNEGNIEEIGRNMHIQYFNLGLLYKELFLRTVNAT
ncbi:MAG: hypothetical protein A3E82_00280 [Gammaproteobacteria bacterium RIFCSPHIGHO2_12_FULL_38_11]|nr:MAG: hypothetical protein A3E82_00280 [Gammaproteobacteria bacterium RIFCSPHIGHO2_12_FULL_38_11]